MHLLITIFLFSFEKPLRKNTFFFNYYILFFYAVTHFLIFVFFKYKTKGVS